MVTLSNTFNNGTIGGLITVANSAASGDPFVYAADCYYDPLSLLGAAGARIDPVPNGELDWDLLPASLTAFTRMAVYVPAVFGLASGAAAFRLSQITVGAGIREFTLSYDETKSPPLFLQYATGLAVIGTFTTPIPRNAWFRIELGYNNGPSEARLALNPFGPHTETINHASVGGATVAGWFTFGFQGDSNDQLHIDEVGVASAGWLGPYAGGPSSGNRMGGTGAIRKPPRYGR